MSNLKKQHWTKLKENEILMVKEGDEKFCDGCQLLLPATLTYFGRSTIKKSEQYKLVYLRPRCRNCFKPKTQAPIERRREIARNHYTNNKNKKIYIAQKYRYRKKLTKHFNNIIEKNKWKEKFESTLELIKKR